MFLTSKFNYYLSKVEKTGSLLGLINQNQLPFFNKVLQFYVAYPTEYKIFHDRIIAFEPYKVAAISPPFFIKIGIFPVIAAILTAIADVQPTGNKKATHLFSQLKEAAQMFADFYGKKFMLHLQENKKGYSKCAEKFDELDANIKQVKYLFELDYLIWLGLGVFGRMAY